jgi:hypothetical protein
MGTVGKLDTVTGRPVEAGHLYMLKVAMVLFFRSMVWAIRIEV